MFSLQKILGQDKKFFDLFGESIEEAKKSVNLLKELVTSGGNPDTMSKLSEVRQKNKQVVVEIKQLLCKTFVTGLDREDIEDLANALYKIPKTIEKFADRYQVVRAYMGSIDFSRHIQLMQEAISIVEQMLQVLREEDVDKLMELNQQLHKVEVRGDELLKDLVCELYSGKYDALKAMILKDLFEMLEKVMDRCRSAGNVMYRIILKHS